ncbi:MAG: 1-acyl-sn-glycerol-3-phosphate acyltransferase [Candidatus Aminicenantes bacterium]|nr:1-acyl-sn-glycerol-3-phosphate acyltransferase [Candidatus Aminicenantes bacterium]
MAGFEEEFEKLRPVFSRWSRFVLTGKKIFAEGTENFIPKGPTIITGNHIGTFKDIATIYELIPRPFVFTANKMIFEKNEFDYLIKKHLRRHFKEVGLLMNALLKPVKLPFIDFVTRTVKKIGTVPVDLYSSKRDAILNCQETVKAGRALITLQGRGRVMKNDPNPYVSPFRRGAAIISYNLYKNEGLRVPVIPMAIFGTHLPLFFPAKIGVNVGEPMYATDYLREGFNESVENFRRALEKKVNSLFFQIIKK